MHAHVEPGELIVEQENAVENGGGKGVVVTERIRERAFRPSTLLRYCLDAARASGENARKYRQIG